MRQSSSWNRKHMALSPRVIVSLLNWNNAQTTLRGLESISLQDYANFEIIVVDNASTDDSAAQIRAMHPSLKLVAAKENNGYASGNALALEIALAEGADLFWIVNPDALVASNTLSELVRAYQRSGEALYGSVPLHRNSETDTSEVMLQTWALGQNDLPDLSRPQRIEGTFADCFSETSPRPIATLHGSSLLIPMSVVRNHGFIDTEFFLYSEESDYCLRLWRAGVPSLLVPTSIVYHQPQGAHKHHPSLKPVIIYHQTRNRLTLLKRYGKLSTYLVSVVKHSAYVVMWVLASVVRGTLALKIAGYTLYGIVDAVRGRMGKTISPENHLNS
jgi:GT2 family glycosyltransferase